MGFLLHEEGRENYEEDPDLLRCLLALPDPILMALGQVQQNFPDKDTLTKDMRV